MKVTKEEALNKWCPYATNYETGNNLYINGRPVGTMCIADHCMMWQFDENDSYNERLPESPHATGYWWLARQKG